MIYQSITHFLSSNRDENITFCVANYAPVDLVENLLISANKCGVSIVLFALDEKLAQTISKSMPSVQVVLYNAGNTHEGDYAFGTLEFMNISYVRYFIAHEILKSGKSLIYLDIDIVVCRDFVSEVLEELHDFEMIMQSNGVNGCTGFFAVKPIKKMIEFFHLSNFKQLEYKNYGGDGGLSDQKFINKFLFDTGFCSIKLLNRDRYPNGGFFYKNHAKIQDQLRIVHFNCILGNANKIAKMKEHSMWYL